MTDARDDNDASDPTPLREEVERELDDLVKDAADEERQRMAERVEEGIDEPS